MVWACAVQTKRFAFCAELNVRYLQPARPEETLIAAGELVSNRRDKLFEAKAELRNQAGVTLAAATGNYLPIKHADVRELATDFVEDPGWVFVATKILSLRPFRALPTISSFLPFMYLRAVST